MYKDNKNEIDELCKIYLEYKDSPELLMKSNDGYIKKIRDACPYCRPYSNLIPNENKLINKMYNRWLFEFLFSNILGD